MWTVSGGFAAVILMALAGEHGSVFNLGVILKK